MVKQAKGKPTKSYEIISDNAKLDTSGMAGKPMPMPEIRPFKMPPMTIEQMMEERERKTSKKPEPEDDCCGCY